MGETVPRWGRGHRCARSPRPVGRRREAVRETGGATRRSEAADSPSLRHKKEERRESSRNQPTSTCTSPAAAGLDGGLRRARSIRRNILWCRGECKWSKTAINRVENGKTKVFVRDRTRAVDR